MARMILMTRSAFALSRAHPPSRCGSADGATALRCAWAAARSCVHARGRRNDGPRGRVRDANEGAASRVGRAPARGARGVRYRYSG